MRGDQERRRFFAGVSVSSHRQHVCAVMVAASGRGLESRFEIASHIIEPLPGEITVERTSCGHGTQRAATSSRVTARITEAAANALERLAAIEHEAWHAALLCGISAEADCIDTALLAEMSQLNIVDGFAARDAVLNGTGQHLDALPLWLLLRHAQLQRLLVQADGDIRLLQLPASRDERGAENIVAHQVNEIADLQERLWQQLNRSPTIADELLWLAGDTGDCGLRDELQKRQPALVIHTADTLMLTAEALPAACAATLAMLHIDQTPANLPFLTGAAAPRVLGRLTPGSAKSWNRLLRDLAFSRPLVTPLRAAV